MDFEKELDKRLTTVYVHNEEQRKKMEEAKREQTLITKTKNIIDPILRITATKFKNAKTEPTHELKPSGEVVFRMGTGSCCFIDFEQNQLFGFSNPCRIGFHVAVQDLKTENIKITHTYLNGPDCLKSYTPILKKFSRDATIVFSGVFNENKIRTAIQNALLATIDTVRANR